MQALVLSGGGNRGALQAGALEVLLAEGLVPEPARRHFGGGGQRRRPGRRADP